jgi:hypothetical protein
VRIGRNIDGLCPFCKQFVLTDGNKKFVWWGNPDTGARPMWRVAHWDCQDNDKPLPPAESFGS